MTESSKEATSGRLLGKSAVITGAAAGIGRATAELFAREGARLVLADINADGLSALRDSLANVTDDVAVVTADVSMPEDVRRMINAAVEQYGRLDIAIANAGIIPLASVVEATPSDWDAVMAVDGRGMFLTCKYAIERQSCSLPRTTHRSLPARYCRLTGDFWRNRPATPRATTSASSLQLHSWSCAEKPGRLAGD
jgi:NAD(P)-dependent dehydrogenase (short-subunit alcohol dehydrogenase family)